MTRLIDRLRLRLRSLFRASEVDQSLKNEIQLHLQEQIDENVAAGMSPSEARAAALRAFGPVGTIEEECRDKRRVAFVEHLLQDLRYTLRSLLRQPMLVAAATLSIAVAIGANVTIFSLASQLLVATPTTHRPDQLVHIRMGNGSHVSHRQWRDLQDSGALAGLAGYMVEVEVNWRGPEQSISLLPLIVTPNYFDLLGVPVAIGRGFTAAEARAELNPRVAVISHGFWQQRLGGDPNVIGRALEFNGEPYVVLGVLPANLNSVPGYGVAPEVYLPLSRALMADLDSPRAATVQLVGRLKDGQSVSEGRAALATVGRQVGLTYGDKHFGNIGQFTPVGTLGQIGDFATVGAFFGVLLLAVGLVLSIACANVAGLLLSRATVTRRELAVRAALGASRRRLIQQLLTETSWLALFGTVGGLLLMVGIVQLMSRISLPLPLPLELRSAIDGRLLTYSLVLMLATIALSGLAPALQATRSALVPTLKHDEPRYGHRRWTLRGFLLVGQIAITLVLLVTAALFVRNLARVQTMDPGFDTKHTLVAQLGFVEGHYTRDTHAAFLEAAIEQLRALPAVEMASYSRGVPLTVRSGSLVGTNLEIAERKGPFPAQYATNMVGPDYFATMGTRLLRGREFRPSDRRGAPAVAIVSEEFARRYSPDSDLLGRHLLLPGANTPYPVEIVGIVSDTKHRSLGEEPRAAVYEPYLQRVGQQRFAHILVRSSANPDATAREVQQILGQMDTTAAIKVEPMSSALAFAFMPSEVGALLVGGLGVLGLALAMVGLFAAVSYSVSRRTAEIGIRIALGATRAAVMRLVLRSAALLTGVGMTIGLALAWFVTQPLAMFLVAGLSASDPIAFLGTALLLSAVSLAATWSPARRAMRIDPVTALRME
jgi:predicted permease